MDRDLKLSENPGAGLHSSRSNFTPHGLYGDLEPFLQGFRASRPLDLSISQWRASHPHGTPEEWRQHARSFVLEKLHYSPGPLDLQAQTLSREQRDGYRLEEVAFNTAPWCRVKGWFLRPDGPGPFPAVVVLHSWGGPKLLGRDRVVSRGKTHPQLEAFLNKGYSGRFIGEDLARRGYAVVVIDALHFGRRLPWGGQLAQNALPNTEENPSAPGLPAYMDPLDLDEATFDALEAKAEGLSRNTLRYLQWAGATWGGVYFWDDSRCVDYLVSRPEVDASRIGCVGQSVGGWRAHMLAALDERIAASVSSCWTTTNDWTHLYNFSCVGPYALLPGLWQSLDLPDIAALAAPRAAMVISGQQDNLFAPEAVVAATDRIREGFSWAGVPEHFEFHFPEKPHSFDLDSQHLAWAWFDRWLKPEFPTPTV